MKQVGERNDRGYRISAGIKNGQNFMKEECGDSDVWREACVGLCTD